MACKWNTQLSLCGIVRCSLPPSWDLTSEYVCMTVSMLNNLRTSNAVEMFERVNATVAPVFTPDGKFALAVDPNGADLLLYDLTKHEVLPRVPSKHRDDITCLETFKDGVHFASGSKDKTIKIWQMKACGIITVTPVVVMSFDMPVMTMCRHPTLKIIAGAFQGHIVKMRQVGNSDVDEVHIALQDSHLTSLIQTDDKIIYGTDVGRIYVWTYESAENPVMYLEGHTCPVTRLACHNDVLVSWAEAESSLIAWRLSTKKQLVKIPVILNEVTVLCFIAEYNVVLLGSSHGNVVGCSLDLGKTIANVAMCGPVGAILHVHPVVFIATSDGQMQRLSFQREGRKYSLNHYPEKPAAIGSRRQSAASALSEPAPSSGPATTTAPTTSSCAIL